VHVFSAAYPTLVEELLEDGSKILCRHNANSVESDSTVQA